VKADTHPSTWPYDTDCWDFVKCCENWDQGCASVFNFSFVLALLKKRDILDSDVFFLSKVLYLY